MDYTTVPQSLIYRKRYSFEEFGAYDQDSFTHPFMEAMLHMEFIQEFDSEERALWCMNTAYYICTMFLLEKDPRWRISDYIRISDPTWSNFTHDFQCLTLSIVALLLDHLEEPLPAVREKAKTEIDNQIRGIGGTTIFDKLSIRLKKYLPANWTIRNSTFAPRVINKETVSEVLSDYDFNWDDYTDNYDERKVRDVVKCFGCTKEEKHNVIEMLRQAFCDRYPEEFIQGTSREDHLLYKIEKEISQQVDNETDQEPTEDKKEELKHQGDTATLQTRIEELEKENARLKVCIQEQAVEIDKLKIQNKELEGKEQNKKKEPENNTFDFLEEWQKLSTRELAIFFSQALGVSFDPKLINQNQLANLAAMWTKPKPDAIRSKIGKLFKEESEVNEGKRDGFSPKTKDEALDVYYFITRISKYYSTITPQMNKILNELNDYYNLGVVEKIDENKNERQITKKSIFDTIDKARKSGEKYNK